MNFSLQTHHFLTRLPYLLLVLFFLLAGNCSAVFAATSLADTPVLAVGSNIPGNVALALSVEFPTAVTSSYKDPEAGTSKPKGTSLPYDAANEFLGYFDANKCYTYQISNGFYNTGVDNNNNLVASGTKDPHWTVTAAPASIGTGVSDIAINGILFFQKSSSAMVLGVTSTSGVNGDYTYQTTFTLPANINPANVVIKFDLSHDNALKSIKVNNSSTGISNNNRSIKTSITLNASNSTFVTGANTISITINNSSSDFGIKVDNASTTVSGSAVTFDGSYFQPVSPATNHTCSGNWSGNLLNWALTQVIDSFRSTMTGGYRSVDTTTTTILEKAWFPPPTYSPTAPSIVGNPILIAQSTPYTNLNNLYIDFQCSGNQFYFSGTASSVTNKIPNGYDCAPTINTTLVPDYAIPASIDATNVYQMYARVKVCHPSTAMGVAGLEANCIKYGSNYKPEGLMQKYAKNLNFAAFGYINEDGITRQGAALRARMGPIGQTISSPSGDTINANPEWNPTTGVYYTNPDSGDISISDASMGVTNSGVLNYVNKFGLASKKYKYSDPVGELYYATLRYLKGQSNVTEYSSFLDSTKLDGFPAITNWNTTASMNPIKYACQRNFILGLGDTQSNPDANVPGVKTTGDAMYRSDRPIPNAVASDTSVNARTATNNLGIMENVGYGNTLADNNYPYDTNFTNSWGCCGGSYRMAGLAYDAHINDISSTYAGTQTVTTYWLDVLEEGDRFNYGGTGKRNQFWLTAKYGGFTGSNPTTGGLALSQWDTNNDGDPDTYFRANDPLKMKNSLESAFSNIVNTVLGSSNGFASTSPSIQSGSLTYATSYNSNGWTGDVVAKQISIDTNGIISTSANSVWSAAAKLEAQAAGTGWDSGRVIATASTQASGCSPVSNTASGVTASILPNSCGTPFRLGSLSATQKTALTSTTANQGSLLNFLRGDVTNEGSLYRNRVQILGDIVNSKVVPIGPPSQPYIDSFNPGYSTFKNSPNVATRPTVVYVGANDGMLHAFDGSNATTGGKELFAYVPNALFQGPSSPSTAASDGLAQLANITYSHHYYVDATPVVADIDFGNKGAIGGVGTPDWHSLLIGGLGKGGKSYFAIDVTKPTELNTEQNLATAVKWEFSHPLMGFTYDTPLVVKTLKYGWVVVLTSGYNNADGKGYIFILDPKTGALKETPIATGAGSTTNDAGLAHVNAFVADARSGFADALYAADLLGNVWRVDLTGTSGSYSALNIATLTDASGTRQPVTTSPVIEVDTSTGKRYVFIGTGKLLNSADLSNTQAQTFYAINDGTLSNFYTSTTLPSVAGVRISFPITRAKMVNNTDVINGITADSAKPMGYFIDLGTNPVSGKTNFVNAELASASGVIAFIANSVDNTDVCNPSARNLTYQLSYGTGQSVLIGSNGSLVSNIGGVGLGVSINFNQVTYTDANGNKITKLVSIKCDDQGNCTIITPKISSTKPFTQLNWRELPTAE